MPHATPPSGPDSLESLYLKKILTHPDLTFLPFSDQKVPFEKLYVNQTVTEEKREDTQAGDRSESLTDTSGQTMQQMAMGQVVKQVAVDLWQKLRQDHRVVVTAPAWTGKSTLCKWVVQQCQTKMHWLPIYIPFRHLSQSSHVTLLSYLEQDYLPWLGLEGVTVEGQQNEERPTASVSLGRWLYDQWQAGQALLILDGADEEFDRTKREATLSALPTTGTRMTRPRVLLTSRPGGETGVLGFEKIELQEFTRKQIEALIRNCGVLLEAQETIQKLLREMKEGNQTRAWQFAGRPGHLIQMVVTYVHEGILLAWKEDHMDRIATRRFQITGRVTPKLDHDDPFLKRQLTEELAFHSLFCRKGQAQTRTQMLDLLTHIIQSRHKDQGVAEIGYRPQQASRLLTDLCTNSSFLKNTRQGQVEWESIPWLQFFAAMYLAQQLEPDAGDQAFQHWAYSPPNEQESITLSCPICHIALPQFAHYLWRPEWQESIVLIGASLSESSNLLKRILKEPEDILGTRVVLIHQILWQARQISRKIMTQAFNSFVNAKTIYIENKLIDQVDFLYSLGVPKVHNCFLDTYLAWLDSALQGKNSIVALRTLVQLGHPHMESILLNSLQGGSISAPECLGQLGNTALIPVLRTILLDGNILAATALMLIGTSDALLALRDLFRDRRWEVRTASTRRFINYFLEVNPSKVLALKAFFHEPDIFSNSFTKTFKAIFQLAPPSEPVLRTILMKTTEQNLVREAAAEALVNVYTSETVLTFGRILIDQKNSERLRLVCARILGQLGSIGALSPLSAALKDSNLQVKKAAIEALGKLGEPGAVLALITTLQDPSGHSRAAAARALGQLGGPVATQALITAVPDRDGEVTKAALEALGALGDPVALPVLITTLQDPSGHSRAAAARALGQLRNTEGTIHPLRAALHDSDHSTSLAAANALGVLGDSEALHFLYSSLGNDDKYVRQTAAKGLQALSEKGGLRIFPDGLTAPLP